MTLPNPTALDYAPINARHAVMPVGAVVLLSFLLAGLGSLLLCGRRRVRLALLLNGGALAIGGLLFVTWRFFAKDEDYAGWLWLTNWVLIEAVGVRVALSDRRQLIAAAGQQATPQWFWVSLFWSAALAAAGIGIGTFTIVVLIGFGGPHALSVMAGAAILIMAGVLITAIVSTVNICFGPH